MRVIEVLVLCASLIEVARSLTDFSKVDFAKSFKEAEAEDRKGLSRVEMQAILEAHNTFRKNAANGKRDRLPTAAGLPLLEWDDRLAYEAQLWADHLVKTDTLGHPSSIVIEPWSACGQNVGSFSTRNMYSIMRGFELEINLYDFDKNVCTPNSDYYTCGHAKQMYFEETTHVGCQARKKKSNSDIVVVCNYGRIASNSAPYTKGAPCSACKGSYPFCLDGLCTSKKVCELAGMSKCKCTKKDSDCGHGASVDPSTCQCTKNCPAEWVSPFCKSKCDDGEGMDGMCPMLYSSTTKCDKTFSVCAKYCGYCVERAKTVGVLRASNVLGLESYPRASGCENGKGVTLCAKTSQYECSENVMIAAACARTCNRCLMLDGVTNWSKKCLPERAPLCTTSGLIHNVCQKLCHGS